MLRSMFAGFLIGIALAFAITIDTGHASYDNANARYVTRVEYVRALRQMNNVLVRACGLRMYEDISIEFERNDNARFTCADFVERIGR